MICSVTEVIASAINIHIYYFWLIQFYVLLRLPRCNNLTIHSRSDEIYFNHQILEFSISAAEGRS